MPTLNTNDPQTQLIFRSTSFSPTAANDLERGTATAYNMSVAGVTDGSYRQAVKADLKMTTDGDLPDEVSVSMCLEFSTGAKPTAGEAVYIYNCGSDIATAANGNSGATNGTDAAYTGANSNPGSTIKQCKLIGVLTCSSDAGQQIGIDIGRFRPLQRYANLVLRNESGVTLSTNTNEHHIVLDPVVSEAQTT